MTLSPGHWYAVLSSRQLGSRPVAKTRFGERLVFWRDAAGAPACLLDRCPHRGAALSLGEVCDGNVACPYHGFEFDGQGRCRRVPVEGPDWTIPEHFNARSWPVREQQEYVWLWRGPAVPAGELPPVPVQPGIDGLVFEECTQSWPAHYTRCVEGVIDHSHLAFVHRKTLGRRISDPTTRIRVDDTDGGFRSNLLEGDDVRHHIDFTYPNVWTQLLTNNYAMSATFAPIDDSRTEVYCRVFHRFDQAFMRPVMQLWCRFSNWLVFHEDQAVLDSQWPRSADDADHEKLVPSDAAVMAFRRLRARHQAEFGDEVAGPATSAGRAATHGKR